MKKNNLTNLRKELKVYNIDGYIIPKNDEFFGEYVDPRNERLKYITGFSGSGKTSVGHHVAARMQREFVDLDVEISEFSNMSIEEIFSEEGEAKFRQIETQILTKVSSTGNQVISTGGGIVENDQNHEIKKLCCS